MTESLDWSIVARAADALGVSKGNQKKWKQRGVPHRWRIPIIRQSGGQIAFEHFDVVGKIPLARIRHVKSPSSQLKGRSARSSRN